MPAFDVALIELGHLLGIFKAGGDVNWEWFGDPIGKGFAALPAERERIGALMRALLDHSSPAGTFLDGTNWEPVFDNGTVGVGFTWSTSNSPATDPLQIGLGSKVSVPVSGQQINLAALARLIRLAGQNVTPELGQVKLGGTFPVPNFLTSGELTCEINAPNVTVGLKAIDKQAQSRQLDYPNNLIAWDAARLAVFVLRAWIKQRSDAGDAFFKRINDHLFPMLGEPAGAIDPFPLVAPMKSQPNFENWSDSIFTTDNNAGGALTFLWHARALLTGNESPSFLNGSFFFPLSGVAQSGNPPTLADALPGNYVRPTGTNGAWVGLLTPPGGPITLVLDLETTNPSRTCRIPLGSFDGSTFTRPNLDGSWQNIVQFISAGSGLPIAGELLKAVASGAGYRLSLFRTNVQGSPFAGFNGDYEVAIYLEGAEQPKFVLGTPAFLNGISFPPDPGVGEALLGDVALWALKAAAPTDDLGELIVSAGTFLQQTVKNGVPDAVDLLTKVVSVAAGNQKIEVPLSSDASLALEIAAAKVKAGVTFGPIESQTIPIYIGLLQASLIVNPKAAPFLDGFSLGFENLRLSQSGTGDGIVASLIPDMREMPGFHLTADYTSQQGLRVTGGGKIPIQRTLGPLEIAALMVDIRTDSFAVALDLAFQMAAITVTAYELGIRYNFKNGGSVEPFLHGLGLAMDTGAIKLAGFFGAVESNGVTDYVGGATVSIAGYFELSAIGGYTQLPDKTSSLFIFASLIAPLGGPPWFFITGVAGGFGYNRSLPAPGLMLEHPFLKVMRGEIAVGADAASALKNLSVHFAAVKGEHWIAAGIQFTAFGFINGKVVVAIAFGNKFSVTILGMASFGIKPICYFEIGIEATADEEKFLLRARLSPNSYVIHPDIFSLQGDFALGAWYKEPYKGDFLFSIGGYHPLFQRPEHYPELIRVGCKAIVYNFVHLSVEVFFACTPQALMAGARASLWAEFAGIAAGLDVYVDVLMKWDPFFLRARLGIHIWFEFFGRHEVGVDLDIWTPKFGGTATIDLCLVEFDVDFGASLAAPPPPAIHEFMSKQLGVPSKSWSGGARCNAFSTDDGAGLFRVEFLKGRSGKEPPPKDEKQEGLLANEPVLMAAEWSFLVRTRIPMGGLDTSQAPAATITGQVDLPLCLSSANHTMDLDTTLTVSAPSISKATRTWLADYFPVANFGEPVPEAQASARDSVAGLKTDKPSIPLVEGIVVDYTPTVAEPPALTASTGEASKPPETYPLPLGKEKSGTLGGIRNQYTFGTASNLPIKLAKGVNRRQSALADLGSRTRLPFTVLTRFADLQRFTKASSGMTFTVAATAGIPVTAPPVSPSRPASMFGVQLRVLPLRSNDPVQKRQMETLVRAKSLKESMITPRGGAKDSFQSQTTVEAGRATQIQFGGGGISSAKLKLGGDQTVRILVLARGGAVLSDQYKRGGAEIPIPKGAEQALLIGEGLSTAPSIPGVERETILLAAGSRHFAGHGCFVSVGSYFDLNVKPMDSLPGTDLFEHASTLRVFFPSPVKEEASLVLKLLPTVERPGPAPEQVRWRTQGAQVRSMLPVVSAGRVAMVLGVVAVGAWSVDIDLGPEWKLDGVVLVPKNGRSFAAELQSLADWDLIDDSMPVHPRGLSSTISLEAKA